MGHWNVTTRIGPETVERIEAAWLDILEAVAGSGRIDKACEARGIDPSHVRAYRSTRPEREQEWQRAREQSADYFADQVAEVASNPGDPATARVRMDAYRWLAAKRNPRAYSDKSSVDVNVRTVDLTRIIEHANQRLAAARNPELARRAADAVDAVIVRAALPASVEDLL
jgi:hypothetical protein